MYCHRLRTNSWLACSSPRGTTLLSNELRMTPAIATYQLPRLSPTMCNTVLRHVSWCPLGAALPNYFFLAPELHHHTSLADRFRARARLSALISGLVTTRGNSLDMINDKHCFVTGVNRCSNFQSSGAWSRSMDLWVMSPTR